MSGRGSGSISRPWLLLQNDQQTSSPPSFNPSSTSQDDSAYEETRDALITGFNIVRDVSEATELLGPLKSTCLLIVRGLEVTKGINNNKKAWAMLTARLERQLITINDYQRRLKGHRCNSDLEPLDALKEYAQTLEEILTEASKEEKRSKKLIKRIIRNTIDAEKVAEWTSRVSEAYERFTEAMDVLQWIQTTEQGAIIREIRDDVRNLRPSNELHKADGEAFLGLAAMMKDQKQSIQDILGRVKKTQKPIDLPAIEEDESFLELAYGTRLDVCHEGTREGVLEQIRGWLSDARSKLQIFWINDVAGTGKSTIAATIAHECLLDRTLAGRFFFTPNSEATSSLVKFCTTVANDMLTHLEPARPTILAAINATRNRGFTFRQQFVRLLIEPLREIEEPVMFVFDALDNCDEDGHRLLLNSLIHHLPSIPHVKALITSRPFASIRDLLEACPIVTGQDVQLYSVHDFSLNCDVSLYIHQNFHLRHLTKSQRTKLSDRSNGLFIWAATAVRLLRRSRQVDIILDMLLHSQISGSLDGLYLEILKKALVDEGARDAFMRTLRIIITVFEPVSISVIEMFVPNNPGVNAFVQDLCSVVKDGDPHRPIHVLHPTFREFLNQYNRANGFFVEPSSSHTLLAHACLRCLVEYLRYDIAGLLQEGANPPAYNYKAIGAIEAKMPRSALNAILYASKYWMRHVNRSQTDIEVDTMLATFLSTKLLNWLEFLSIYKRVPYALEVMAQFIAALPTSNITLSPTNLELCADFLRFAQYHQSVISESAIEIYRSALFFTPPTTPIFLTYHDPNQAVMPKVLSGMARTWEPNLALNGHTRRVCALKFSPDSKILASSSMDGSFRMWNTSTGAAIGEMPDYYSRQGQLRVIEFTPDSTVAVTNSGNDHDILLWDCKTGDLREARLAAHEGAITALAVSPLGTMVASASEDGTIRLWNLMNVSLVETVALSHRDPVRRLAFSPDGTLLSSMMGDELILWAVTSLVAKVTVHMSDHGTVTNFSFSPDSKTVFTGHESGHFCIVDVLSQTILYSSTNHSNAITCLAVSHNGAYIVTGAKDGAMLLWNVKSFPPTSVSLQGHSRSIKAISFTEEGSQFISMQWDDSFKVWDVSTGMVKEDTIGEAAGSITSSSISPDASQIAVAYSSGFLRSTIILSRVKNVISKRNTDAEHHSAEILCLVLSPDHEIIASGSRDCTARLWSIHSGNCLTPPLLGHKGPICCLQFSPYGRYLATGSEDNCIRIWKKTGEAQTALLKKHTNHISCLEFSRDEEVLVSGSKDHTICIWKVMDGGLAMPPVHGHTDWVSCIAVVDQKNILVSASRDCTLRFWDFSSGDELTEHRSNRQDLIRNLITSPTREYLAVVSRNTAELWSVVPEVKQINAAAHSGSLHDSGYFSEDGEYFWLGAQAFSISKSRIELLLHTASMHPLSELQWNYDGWITVMHPRHNENLASAQSRKLFKLPGDVAVMKWIACGGYIALGTISGALFVIDCHHLLTSDAQSSMGLANA